MKTLNAASIKLVPIPWLWPQRIPLGRCTIIEGDPGCRKSGLTMDMVATVTLGKDWPDKTPCPEGQCVVVNCEDPKESVILPRLIAAGAELGYVEVMDLDDPDHEPLLIPTNVASLGQLIKVFNDRPYHPPVKLVVIDPIDSFAAENIDLNRSQQARRAIRSLDLLATKYSCAIVIVRHLKKAGDRNTIYRGLGSISIIGAARSAISVALDPSDDRRTIMAPAKGNWSAPPSTLAFRLLPVENGASRLEWLGEVRVKAAELNQADSDDFKPGELEEARAYLLTEMAGGLDCDSTSLFAGGKSQGISREAIWKASRLLGVDKRPSGTQGHWYWTLPKERP